MISRDNINTGEVINKKEAFDCQLEKQKEKKRFDSFLSTPIGKEMEKFKDDIINEVEVDEQRGAVSVNKLEEKIKNKKEYSVYESNQEKIAFTYKLYNEIIDITISSIPSEENYFTITILDKKNNEEGRYVVEDNKNEIIDIIIHLCSYN